MFPEDDRDATEPGEEVRPEDPAAEYAEPDPEGSLPDPERELPSVPEPPTAPNPPEADVPGDLQRAFWTTVIVFNVALLSLSVGAMMVAFGVHRTLGAGLVVVGLASMVRGVLKYRALSNREWSEAD
ncbi:hypothetical protein BRC81_11545 [Halobacteriales archaeon QS_1_68_20]|nr:MAG: hypothetical protein BRC81_11545 [Halobacteriales archaeon QS_1_68_20]